MNAGEKALPNTSAT
ncbi:LPKTxAVK-anchored surface protein [Sulfitobacter sp. F26204]